jgi:hypothetical protein
MYGGEDVSIKIIPDENVKYIKKLNDKNIYKIKIEECYYYFSFSEDDSKKYILLHNSNINNKAFYFFKMPDAIKDYHLNSKKLDIEYFINTKMVVNNDLPKFLKNIYSNIKHRYFYDKNCISLSSIEKLESAKKELAKLNETIKQKCPEMKLELDYLFNINNEKVSVLFSNDINSLVLCLCNDKIGCISCIQYELNTDNNIVISSKTDEEYEGKKYNSLVRSAIIIISKYIFPTAEKIISYAINPISVWVLLKNFNAIIPSTLNNEDIIDYFNENNISINEINFDNIKNFYDMDKEYESAVELEINLTPDNINNARNIFNKIINEENKFKCITTENL